MHQVWVVTYHFGRGNVLVCEFISAEEAEKSIRITVFNNKDCVNCNIYLKEVYNDEITEEAVDDTLDF